VRGKALHGHNRVDRDETKQEILSIACGVSHSLNYSDFTPLAATLLNDVNAPLSFV